MIQKIKAALEMKSCIRDDYLMQTVVNFIINLKSKIMFNRKVPCRLNVLRVDLFATCSILSLKTSTIRLSLSVNMSMKAVMIHECGDSSKLSYEDGPVPEQGPDEVTRLSFILF